MTRTGVREQWKTHVQGADAAVHPFGAPPVPRDPHVGLASWLTAATLELGVVRTLAVHSATGAAPVLTTLRSRSGGEVPTGPAACLVRDAGYFSDRAVSVVEELYAFSGMSPVCSVMTRVEGVLWRSFSPRPGVNVTLAYGAEREDPGWRWEEVSGMEKAEHRVPPCAARKACPICGTEIPWNKYTCDTCAK